MTRTATKSALATLALGVGVWLAARLMFQGATPPGLISPFVPAARYVGLQAVDRAARAGIVALIAISPAMVLMDDAPFDAAFDGGHFLDASAAGLSAYMRGVSMAAVAALSAVILVTFASPSRACPKGTPTERWIARSQALFKRRGALQKPRPFYGARRGGPFAVTSFAFRGARS